MEVNTFIGRLLLKKFDERAKEEDSEKGICISTSRKSIEEFYRRLA